MWVFHLKNHQLIVAYNGIYESGTKYRIGMCRSTRAWRNARAFFPGKYLDGACYITLRSTDPTAGIEYDYLVRAS